MAKVKSVTVPLEHDCIVDGVEWKELTFRRMKAKDALVAEGETNEAKAGYLLFAALADVDVRVIEELDIEDFEAVSEKVVPLMGKSAMAAVKAAKEKAAQEESPSSGET